MNYIYEIKTNRGYYVYVSSISNSSSNYTIQIEYEKLNGEIIAGHLRPNETIIAQDYINILRLCNIL